MIIIINAVELVTIDTSLNHYGCYINKGAGGAYDQRKGNERFGGLEILKKCVFLGLFRSRT
jgi:hypothetical protein